MSKTKIAIFDLTGCQGCEFHLLSLNEPLLDFFEDFEIVNWRLISDHQKTNFDITFVDGAVTTKKQIKLLKQIREASKVVIAFGTCALSGNVFAELTPKQRKKLAPKIYDKNYRLKAKFLSPVEKFIKVDKKVPGCPPNLGRFKKILEELKGERVSSKVGKVEPFEYITRIEGHGALRVSSDPKRVKFIVEESERLIEGLLLGKPYYQAPFITSRICGICPIAHNLCSWLAIEDAFKIKSSQETVLLRRIFLSAQIVKSHLLHLFFLALPDYLGVKSSIELSQKFPKQFQLMVNLKRVADKALKLVGGSTIFPINTNLGGFKNIPSSLELQNLGSLAKEGLNDAYSLIELFSILKTPELKVKSKYATIIDDNRKYPLYPGGFPRTIKEIIKRGSTAKIGVLKNEEVVKVGALARIFKFRQRLNPKAKKAYQEIRFSFDNPFNANLAQAVEVLHFLEEISTLVEELKDKNLRRAEGGRRIISLKEVSGKGCLEAPRGVLIHQVKINPQGKITDYNIIPPTEINLASLEKEVKELIKKNPGLSLKKTKMLVERLIRALDPCITCAVH